MDDRTPGQRMTYLEALCSLPDSAIILFGGDMVTASAMSCVRDPQYSWTVKIYASSTSFVQLYEPDDCFLRYLCSMCLRPFNDHEVCHAR